MTDLVTDPVLKVLFEQIQRNPVLINRTLAKSTSATWSPLISSLPCVLFDKSE